MDDELHHANASGLPNYTCYQLNKYGPGLKDLPGGYDFIVDNNLSSFACCRRHFTEMMRHYVALLGPAGVILTDEGGMRFCQDFAFPVSERDLTHLFPDLKIRKDGTVVSLSRK